MRVSREKAAETRRKVLETASALFREKGIDGVGVADIMKAAGLTHGGFYGHFDSKEALAAEACRSAAACTIGMWEKVAARAPDAPLEAVVTAYLSERHRDSPAAGCLYASMGTDARRQGDKVRAAFSEGLGPMLAALEKMVPDAAPQERRRRAMTIMAEMVGALVLSRAVDDPALSAELLAAAREDILRRPTA